MRRSGFATAVAVIVLAAVPAAARDGAFYAGLEAGPTLKQTLDYDFGAIDDAVKVRDKNGIDAGGTLGYDFGPFRTEVEASFKTAKVDSLATKGVSGIAAGVYDAQGKTTAQSMMLNLIADVGKQDRINGFVGAGAGITRVKADDYRVAGGPTFLDDSDAVLAWQLLAGMRAPISETLDVTLKYRYFQTDDLKLRSVAGAQVRSKYQQHSLVAGVTLNLGADASPPPPPPPEPAPTPPPPAPSVEVPTNFIIFFDWDKSDITTEAAGILDNAASTFLTTGQASVTLAGHADRSGPVAYNVRLSQRRADAARTYLAGKGVPENVIASEAFGESRPLVDTADGVREPQNRRVQINLGPGSGR